MELDVYELENQSIQEYDQCTSMMRGIRGSQDSQGKWGQTSSMVVHYIFAEPRVQLTRSWKEEGFGYLDNALIMCEMMYPSTFSSVRLVCAVYLKGKYER